MAQGKAISKLITEERGGAFHIMAIGPEKCEEIAAFDANKIIFINAKNVRLFSEKLMFGDLPIDHFNKYECAFIEGDLSFHKEKHQKNEQDKLVFGSKKIQVFVSGNFHLHCEAFSGILNTTIGGKIYVDGGKSSFAFLENSSFCSEAVFKRSHLQSIGNCIFYSPTDLSDCTKLMVMDNCTFKEDLKLNNCKTLNLPYKNNNIFERNIEIFATQLKTNNFHGAKNVFPKNSPFQALIQ